MSRCDFVAGVPSLCLPTRASLTDPQAREHRILSCAVTTSARMRNVAMEALACVPQVAAQMKGDREDRIKIQARKESDKRRMEDEQRRDELLLEATTMARMGAR